MAHIIKYLLPILLTWNVIFTPFSICVTGFLLRKMKENQYNGPDFIQSLLQMTNKIYSAFNYGFLIREY